MKVLFNINREIQGITVETRRFNDKMLSLFDTLRLELKHCGNVPERKIRVRNIIPFISSYEVLECKSINLLKVIVLKRFNL